MILFALKLLLAHLFGDFLLQPSSWVKAKEKRKIKSLYLYAHIGVHFLLLLTILGFDRQFLWGVMALVTAHFLIDVAKLYSAKWISSLWGFILDQILHLLTIAWIVHVYFPFRVDVQDIYHPVLLLSALFLLLNTSVAAVVIKVVIASWKINDALKPELIAENENTEERSLNNAGRYIGILERLFVFGFVVLNFWAGIGFLLAAKSIFRFGDLTRAKDRSLTEYVLIGTLLSFGIAIICGLGFNYLHQYIGKIT